MAGDSSQPVLARLAEIEAAFGDLKPAAFGVVKVGDIGIGSLMERRYRNRLHGAFLLLYQLQDDVKRRARRNGLPKAVVDEFVGGSLWVKSMRAFQ